MTSVIALAPDGGGRGTRLERAERHRRIIAELRSNPTVRISALADVFRVSTETVRRDIDHLSDRGLVARTYGGATTSMGREPAVRERNAAMVAERERIAAAAAALVAPGDVLMIDSGATTLHLARRLAALAVEVTVITNGLDIALALGGSAQARVILCPGTFAPQEAGVYGQDTCAFLNRFHATLAFTSAGGLTEDGPTDVDSQACWVKRTMFERSKRGVFMMDHAKFNVPLLERVMPLAGIADLVTDTSLPPGLARAVQDAGLALRIADA
ncbi:DeoR/GlpR family DNA-binding transcription regulator [Zavarzinia sp. CC-PAN008]|uniref:DeoR/GlpR family DNA-binding transcription regulator n=1 Tax=Zavarzinia sp. CC-PAN008 TaxID=3243332 RepID=UPI003F743DF0